MTDFCPIGEQLPFTFDLTDPLQFQNHALWLHGNGGRWVTSRRPGRLVRFQRLGQVLKRMEDQMLVGVASVQVRCGRGHGGQRTQEVRQEEHPASGSQQVQTGSSLALPLGSETEIQS